MTGINNQKNMPSNKQIFLDEVRKSFSEQTFLSLKISKSISKDDSLEKIAIKIISIKKNKMFNFLYVNKTQDITKNFSLIQGIEEINLILGTKFKNAVLFNLDNDINLFYNKKMIPQIKYSKPTGKSLSTKHDHQKKRIIDFQNSEYLQLLGVLNQEKKIIQTKRGKFRQIHRFIETFANVLGKSSLNDQQKILISDMGAGKGYLTFAIYDYVKNILKKEPSVNGIEYRQDLVDKCNNIANKCNYQDLHFSQGTIQNYHQKKNNILIALHACDTATDDAIYKAIQSDSEIIILSPCCHKQIRREIHTHNILSEITKYGILKERQSEIVTDTLRGLILESYGYKTQIFEYIADEHTHKNLMIVGVKKKDSSQTKNNFSKIAELKNIYGINTFYLEELFKS